MITKMMKLFAIPLALLCSLGVADAQGGRNGALQQPPRSKTAPDLQDCRSKAQCDVIVRFKVSADDAGVKKLVSRGAGHKKALPVIGSHLFTLNAAELGSLANDPDVDYISPDRVLNSTAFNGMPDYGWMTVSGITVATGTLPYDGTGIGIALLDSGINDREDLKDASGHNRIVYKQGFVPNDSKADDAYGHGNHVAGLIAGSGKKSTGT